MGQESVREKEVGEEGVGVNRHSGFVDTVMFWVSCIGRMAVKEQSPMIWVPSEKASVVVMRGPRLLGQWVSQGRIVHGTVLST